jgi:hypothetical protein
MTPLETVVDLCLHVVEPHIFTASLVCVAVLKFRDAVEGVVDSELQVLTRTRSATATTTRSSSRRQRQLTACVRLLFEEHLFRYAAVLVLTRNP